VYGVGTSVVVGSGAPTAGMVYKLVEVDGIPVEKRSSNKASRGGTKRAVRFARDTGTLVEEVVYSAHADAPGAPGLEARELLVPLVRSGETACDATTLEDSRSLLAAGLVSLPWEGLKLSRGEPAVPVRFAEPESRRA
jgi:nicotinate phosphoribosyltransferase